MRSSILIAMALWLCAAPARATVLIPADLSELARDARVIARGQVVAVDAQWTEDRRTVETIVTLVTETYLKGSLDPVLRFKVPGGTIGRVRNVVLGSPRFDVGQRVIVFLGASGPRLPYLLGLSQGVYRVAIATSGAALVTPPPVMPGTRGALVRGTAARQPAPLADFERSVRTLASAAR
jgi:hypothetical protein